MVAAGARGPEEHVVDTTAGHGRDGPTRCGSTACALGDDREQAAERQRQRSENRAERAPLNDRRPARASGNSSFHDGCRSLPARNGYPQYCGSTTLSRGPNGLECHVVDGRPAAEERSVAQADAADIVVRSEAGRGPPDGVEPRYAPTSDVEYGTVGVGDEHRRCKGGIGVGPMVDAQVDRSDAARWGSAYRLGNGSRLCDVGSSPRAAASLYSRTVRASVWGGSPRSLASSSGVVAANPIRRPMTFGSWMTIRDHVDDSVVIAESAKPDSPRCRCPR